MPQAIWPASDSGRTRYEMRALSTILVVAIVVVALVACDRDGPSREPIPGTPIVEDSTATVESEPTADLTGTDGEAMTAPTPIPTPRPEPTPTRTPRPTVVSLFPSPTPDPDPTPTRVVIADGSLPCTATGFGYFPQFDKNFLEWTADGAHLIFRNGYSTIISAVDAEGVNMRTIVDLNPGHAPEFGFHVDVSPNSSRIVYSSCEYETESLARGFYDDADDWWGDREKYHYEIATVAIDGTSPERLTENDYFDHFPEWSPDGTRIAFVADLRTLSTYIPWNAQLFTMSADGSGVSEALTIPDVRIGLHPPKWSPDGGMLAFIAFEGKFRPLGGILYTVRADGSELTRIGETATLPTWSPDSENLAFARADEEGGAIYTVRRDGTGMRETWRGEPILRSYGLYDPSASISQVSWSPDGTELLFVSSEGIYVLGLDGGGLRRLALPRPGTQTWTDGPDNTQAVWSPDGSRIAIYFPSLLFPNRLILTMTRDGKDVRVLARGDEEGRLHAWNPPRRERSVDLAVCSAGFVVPEPEANPGLVGDCEILLIIRDELGGRTSLRWNRFVPISEWVGVTLGGSPLRVHELTLAGRGLTGRIPLELTRLIELRRLDLSSTRSRGVVSNGLAGPIPAELGALTELEVLDLSGNFLSGSIPKELGALVNLRGMDLRYNALSGPIPPELGALVNLEWLYLSGNGLEGEIPPELGNLSKLVNLYLAENQLEGAIPRQLGGLTHLTNLRLDGNRLSGCIHADLPGIWVTESQLKRCDPSEVEMP